MWTPPKENAPAIVWCDWAPKMCVPQCDDVHWSDTDPGFPLLWESEANFIVPGKKISQKWVLKLNIINICFSSCWWNGLGVGKMAGSKINESEFGVITSATI